MYASFKKVAKMDFVPNASAYTGCVILSNAIINRYHLRIKNVLSNLFLIGKKGVEVFQIVPAQFSSVHLGIRLNAHMRTTMKEYECTLSSIISNHN